MSNYNSIGTKCAKAKHLLIAGILVIVFIGLSAIFMPSKAQTIKSQDKVLKDTVIANKSYKLMLGRRGGKYVVRVSASGKTYKQYFKK